MTRATPPRAPRTDLRAPRTDLRDTAALFGTALWRALSPASWPRTVRAVLARQVLFSGVDALWFVIGVAVLAGFAVVLQAQVWLGEIRQSQLLGPLLVAVLVRELAPLLVNTIVLVRSGGAIATEVASMQGGGEVRLLAAQGIDPIGYLVMPRMLALAIAVPCLTVFFLTVAFATGYVSASVLSIRTVDALTFTDSLLRHVQPIDAVNLAAKCVLPSLATGAICCAVGLRAGAARTAVPQAAAKALAQSLAATFVISVVVSVWSYL